MSLGILACSGLSCIADALVAADGSHDLRISVEPGQVQRVRVLLEVNGQLKLSGEDKQVTRLPLQVNAELLYDERVLEFNQQNGCRKDLRHYDTAQADLRIGDTSQSAKLPADRRLAVTQVGAEEIVLFSPLAPLTRDELELLEVQANSTVLFRLAPPQPVAIGDEWQHDDSTLAALLCLDTVTQNDVKSTLRQVENSLAIVDLEGNVNGAVRAVASDIQVRGKYNIDLRQHTLTWLTLSITEKREHSPAEPGLEVVARLRAVMGPTALRKELSDEATKDLDLQSSPATTLLTLTSAGGGFQFLHGRPWRVMADRTDVAILRMMEQGNLIAQCNASRLNDLPAGQHVQIESFQADVQRALGEHFSEFSEVSQETAESGLRIQRVVVAGVVSELPIQWIYYHVSDDQGHQAALVFTMDSRLVEDFAESDRVIIESFQFVPGQAAPAAEASTAAQPNRGNATPPRR